MLSVGRAVAEADGGWEFLASSFDERSCTWTRRSWLPIRMTLRIAPMVQTGTQSSTCQAVPDVGCILDGKTWLTAPVESGLSMPRTDAFGRPIRPQLLW